MLPKMEYVISLGVFFIIIGFIIVFLSALSASSGGASKTKVAIGGFIGPIPFGFGNDKNLVWFVTVLSAALILFWLFSLRIIKYH